MKIEKWTNFELSFWFGYHPKFIDWFYDGGIYSKLPLGYKRSEWKIINNGLCLKIWKFVIWMDKKFINDWIIDL